MSHTIKLSLISVALLSQLNAEEINLKPIAITSTAIATDELKSTDAVEVYTQKEIENAHVQNVYEFLNQQTSIYATSAYGNPFMQKLDMRGYGVGDGYQNIVITINGRKMNNVDMVPQLLSSISPSSIKKIEIIKSSGIVVGGDGANAGVINIITREGNEQEVSFYMGSYGLVDGSVYMGRKDENLTVSFAAETQKNEGTRFIDNNGNKDENQLFTASLELIYTAIADLELSVNFATTKTDVTYGGTMTQDEYNSDPTQQGTSFGFGSAYSTQAFDSKVAGVGFAYDINDDLSIKGQISDEKKTSDYAIPAYGSTGTSDYKYVSMNAYVEYLAQRASVKVGVDGFFADLDYQNSSNVNLSMAKDNKAAYVMSEFYLDELTFKAGYRYENMKFSESSGDKKSENLHGVELGVNYTLSKHDSLYANYSHGYQTASLDRLFSYTNPATGYMGYIEPSQSNNYSIGYNNIQKNNKLKISAYYIDLKNEIYYYSDPSYVNSKNTNIDKSHKYGLDVYDKYIVSREFNVAVNYNYVQAIIDEEVQNGENYSNNELPGVSNHNVKATFSYLPNEFFTIAFTQLYRSSAYAAEDFHNNFSQTQEAYASTNIAETYAKDNWEVFAKINNLFNQSNGLWVRDDAVYPVNYTTTAMAGFKLKY